MTNVLRRPNTVLGKHAIIDLSGCNTELLKNHKRIHDILVQAAWVANVTVVGSMDHLFSPQGYTAVLVLEESHLSIHTWPEHGYVSIDLYSCNLQTDFHAVKDFLADQFQASVTEFKLLQRGYSSLSNGANGVVKTTQEKNNGYILNYARNPNYEEV